MRKNRSLPLLRDVTVTGIAAEGKAIAKYDDMVIFVPFLAPGDIADIRITKKRKKYLEGRCVELKTHSAYRAEPFCEHFGVCGGCKWQHIAYEHQLVFKQKHVVDHFERIGKIKFPSPEPLIPSQKTDYYRNKLEFTFTNRRWLTEEEIIHGESIREFRAAGFHIPGRFDKVLDINKCYLQEDPSNSIRLAIKNYALLNKLEFFDLIKQEGFLRTLIIRTTPSGEVMVILVFYREDKQVRESMLNWLNETFPEITSLMYVINSKGNDTITDLDVNLFSGRDHIKEEMEGLQFRVGPKSFYQTNSLQAYELYKVIREFVFPQKHEVIYDLYSGTGTIALFLANQSKRICGLEYVPEAVKDAVVNANTNGIENARFYAGDIKDLLTPDFIRENGAPHTIIADPPRTGMHPAVIERIMDISPGKVVYVSCNSATQARDIQLLDSVYRIDKMRALDMFPQTQHIENVVLMVKR